MSGEELIVDIGGGVFKGRMAAALLAQQNSRMPAAFPWDRTNYDLNSTMTLDAIGTCDLDLLNFFSGYTGWTTFYVDVARPDDSGDGLSWATAKRTASAGWTLYEGSPSVNVRIMIKAGYYNRNRNMSAGAVFPGKAGKVAWVASNGRVNMTTGEDLTWAANATYSWVYETARTNVSGVFKINDRDELGAYPTGQRLTTLADVSRVPGSWAEVGSQLYHFPADGVAVTNANTRVLLAVDNLRHQGTVQHSCLLVGETARDGFDFEGGQAACWRTLYTGGAGGTRVVHGAINCTFRYGGHVTGGIGNVGIEGLNGLAYFINCDFSFGSVDGLNGHNVLGASMYVLTLNCTGLRNGRYSYTSCNGWTIHDTVIGMDICGEYRLNKGRNIHIIDASRAFLSRTLVGGSRGDRAAGGNNYPGEITTEGTSQIWIDWGRILPLAGNLACTAYDTSQIHKKRTKNRGTDYADATALIDSWTA